MIDREKLDSFIEGIVEMAEHERYLSFMDLQAQVAAWSNANFDGKKPYQPLLGAVEEMGELAHAHLKAEQGIRGTKSAHEAAGKDAVGDVIIYLCDYCTQMGWDLQQIVEETWATVRARNWKKNPENGR